MRERQDWQSVMTDSQRRSLRRAMARLVYRVEFLGSAMMLLGGVSYGMDEMMMMGDTYALEYKLSAPTKSPF